MIPLFKIFINEESLYKNNLIEELRETLYSGQIGQGPRVDELEKELSINIKNPNVCLVNSGTSAIHLALTLIKQEESLSDNTEVLTTPITCFASNAPILHNRMKIKWCDIDSETMNINLDDVKNKLTNNTRILMVVDWGGYPIDYGKIDTLKYYYKNKFKKDLYVIEDAAHAFGSTWYSHPVGFKRTHFTCFSFQAIKHLTTGDGGLLVTPDNFYKQARLMRWFGLDRDNKADFRGGQDIVNAGYKFHMNDIAATIGLSNLKEVGWSIKRSRDNAKFYNENIKNDNIQLMKYDKFVDSSYWLYTILVNKPDGYSFEKYMQLKGIQVNKVHHRNDKLTALKQFQTKLPELDRIDNYRYCIPCHFGLTEQDREHILETINAY